MDSKVFPQISAKYITNSSMLWSKGLLWQTAMGNTIYMEWGSVRFAKLWWLGSLA